MQSGLRNVTGKVSSSPYVTGIPTHIAQVKILFPDWNLEKKVIKKTSKRSFSLVYVPENWYAITWNAQVAQALSLPKYQHA